MYFVDIKAEGQKRKQQSAYKSLFNNFHKNKPL